MSPQPDQNEERLPLVSEEAEIETRETVTGRARVLVKTEHLTQDIPTELVSEDVEIIHVARGEMITPGAEVPRMREEDGVTIIPVLEEIAVVETRLRLKEEIHIIRRRRSETAVTPVTLRRQRAVIEHLSVDGDAPQHPELKPTKT